MNRIFLIALFLISGLTFANAQQSASQDIANAQADIGVQQAKINSCNGIISSAQTAIAVDNTVITNETALNNLWNTQYATTLSGWNFDYDAQLENAGIRWTQFPAVFPSANLTAIAAQLNITCPVAETQVNWQAWPKCEADGVNWTSFYCQKGIGC